MKFTKQRLIFLALLCFAIYSCKTEEVYFNVTEPAPVSIPMYVKRLGIINASIVSDSSSRKKMDDALSAKGPQLDKECSNESIRGLKDALVQSNIFQSIVYLDSVHIQNDFPGTFPSPLSWDKVQEICRLNNVDAIVVLELFHTAIKLNAAVAAASLTSVGAAALMGATSIQTVVTVGWRVYDPQNKIILDEYPVTESLPFASGMLNPIDAATAVMNHKETVMSISYNAGQAYANRMLPYVIRVCREFYVGGNDNFKMSRRMADAGDWDKAADIWKKETQNPKLKMQAMADYDIGIISEMNGNVDSALVWVKKAYETNGKRLALIYLNQLRNRKVQNDILSAQKH